MLTYDDVQIPVDGGFAEGRLLQKGSGSVRVLLIHPWALLGGCMDDPVLAAIARATAKEVNVESILLYNQKSYGAASLWKGREAAREAASAATFLYNLSNQQMRVVVVGYSYGACLASAIASHTSVAALALISPPIGRLANLFLGSWETICEGCSSFKGKILLVCGTKDQFASISQIRDLEQKLGTVLLSVQILENADHFYYLQKVPLANHVANFIASLEADDLASKPDLGD